MVILKKMAKQEHDFSDVVDLDKDDDVFIDAESDFWKSNKDGYEGILLRHLNECVKLLSMDKYSCYDKIKTKEGYEHIIKKNLNELIIRGVDTLRMLMAKQLSRNPGYEKKVKAIIKQCKQYEHEYGEKYIMQPGIGRVQIKSLLLSDEHPIKKQLLDYHAKRYRSIFEILIRTYMKAKEQAIDDGIDRTGTGMESEVDKDADKELNDLDELLDDDID